jgi:5-formyltetrahydrofolate cyclo-ligase
MKILRKTLDTKEISKKICSNVELFPQYTQAKNILIFYPLKYEIDLRYLLTDNKNFYLPKVSGNNLLICPYKKGDKLKKSKFGVMEPITEPIDIKNIDFIFVPGVCADYSMNRIGYGKGFYDIFLKKTSAFKLMPIAKSCVIFEIPANSYDAKVNMLMTEKGVIC